MNIASSRLAALRAPDAPARDRNDRGITRRLLATRSWLTRQRRAHALQMATGELAALLDSVSRRCASGDSLGAGLSGALAAVRGEGRASGLAPFAGSATVLARGGTVRDAVGAVTSRHPDVVLAVHVLDLCARQGGNISESLDRAAATLRERETARLEREAQSAQARLSARVLTVVPILFAAWTLATSPTVRAFTTTPAGVAFAAAGIAANVTGWRWMRRAIRSSA